VRSRKRCAALLTSHDCPSGTRPEVTDHVRCVSEVAAQSSPLRHNVGGGALVSLGHRRPRPRAGGATTDRLPVNHVRVRMIAPRRPRVGGSVTDRLEVLGFQPASHRPSGTRPEVVDHVRCVPGVAAQSSSLRHKAGGGALVSLGHRRPRPRAGGMTTDRLPVNHVRVRMIAPRRPRVGGSVTDRLEVLGFQPASHRPSGTRPEVVDHVRCVPGVAAQSSSLRHKAGGSGLCSMRFRSSCSVTAPPAQGRWWCSRVPRPSSPPAPRRGSDD